MWIHAYYSTTKHQMVPHPVAGNALNDARPRPIRALLILVDVMTSLTRASTAHDKRKLDYRGEEVRDFVSVALVERITYM